MTSEPLDTRITNGRFVGPDAPASGSLTIHDGIIVEAPDQPVWRTVNASGHLVFPGIAQPAGINPEDALIKVRGGITTAISDDEVTSSACLDIIRNIPEALETIEPDESGELTEEQWSLLLSDEPVHFLVRSGHDFPIIHFLYHEGHLRRSMTLDRIAALTSGNIAKAAGFFPQKGSFAPGSDGDLFVFDPDSEDQYSEIRWPGRVIFSLLRGSILLYNGQIHTNPGDGMVVS